MDMNERKIRILEFIIKDYIASAEPVGSRTIAKKYDLGLSSATIRNEMSDLEEMGYILAPHASAGRVPSDKGYRLFVDRLLRRRPQEDIGLGVDELRFLETVIARNINQIDYLMRETAKAISVLTNYTAVVSETTPSTDSLAHLQLMPVDESSVLLVIVTASKKIKNHIIRLTRPPDYDDLMILSKALNTHLADITGPLPPSVIARLQKAFVGHEALLDAIVAALVSAIDDGADNTVYTSGIKNILAFPEFADNLKARALFEALEEPGHLIQILENAGLGVSVLIGQENALIELRDCSIVTTPYTLDGDVHGHIAIIGPTRMDYPQALCVLQGMVKRLNGALKALEGG